MKGRNMKQVTQDEFFKALYADPRDIMPRVVGNYPYKSEWRNQKSIAQELFGVSQSGETNQESTYYLIERNQP
jgi:hypothetical protein